MDTLSEKQKRDIIKTAQKILKLPGNSPKGDVLEVALVLDCSLDRDYLCETAKDILSALHHVGKPFLNLRLNLIKWRSDEEFIKYVSSYPEMLMGRAADEKDILQCVKHYDALMEQLKKFYARSRIVFFLSAGDYECIDHAAVTENLNPFLGKKILPVYPDRGSVYPLPIKENTVPGSGKDDVSESKPARNIASENTPMVGSASESKPAGSSDPKNTPTEGGASESKPAGSSDPENTPTEGSASESKPVESSDPDSTPADDFQADPGDSRDAFDDSAGTDNASDS